MVAHDHIKDNLELIKDKLILDTKIYAILTRYINYNWSIFKNDLNEILCKSLGGHNFSGGTKNCIKWASVQILEAIKNL